MSANVASTGDVRMDELDWREIHESLLQLAQRSAQLDWEIGQALLRAEKARCHEQLGYGSVIEYADRLLGFAPHTTRERLRVARALEQLPELTAALKTGEVSPSSARELTRVATPATEADWLRSARNRRVREFEELVRGHQPGDSPDDPKDEWAEIKVLRHEVRPEVYALWRDLEALIDREAGEPLDASARLELIARRVLQGTPGEGRAGYQIALTTCRECQRTWQQGRGKQVLVDDSVRKRAECDAQHIGAVDSSEPPTGNRASQTIPPATRRKVLRRDGGCCAVPGCNHSDFLDLHHTELRSEGGTHEPNKLITLCSAHHTATHDGRLLIDGDAVRGFSFRHADGTEYGAPPAATTSDVFAKAFADLVHSGFQSKHVRPALERVRSHVGPAPTAQDVVRAALRELTG